MLKKVFAGVAVACLVAALGAVILGRDVLSNVLRTGRARARAAAREHAIDGEVEIEARVKEIQQRLPADIVALRGALRETDQLMTTGVVACKELADGLRLLDSDLATLAGHLRNGEGCDIRGKELSLSDARGMATDLLQRRADYVQRIKARQAAIDTLRAQREKVHEQLAAAERALADFGAKAKQVKAKLALVKVAERIDRLRRATGPNGFVVTPASLDGLERDLDRRIEEADVRHEFVEGLTSKDEYAEAAKEANVVAQLDALFPAAQPERREGKK